jgi:hypothetical protein
MKIFLFHHLLKVLLFGVCVFSVSILPLLLLGLRYMLSNWVYLFDVY